MITATMCGWCHEMVPASLSSCPNCGHDAHVSRLECGCPRCRPPTQAMGMAPILGMGRPSPAEQERLLDDLEAGWRDPRTERGIQ